MISAFGKDISISLQKCGLLLPNS